jgi:hypothetical protein
MKSFFTYTAIIEALTGLGLIFVPSRITLLLFETTLSNSLEIVMSMIAGAAIFSLALYCWFSRLSTNPLIAIRTMLIYNFAVAAVILYGALALGFKGPALWLVIIFHFFQTAICALFLNKKKNAH